MKQIAGQRGVRGLDRPVLRWTWRGWALFPVFGMLLLLWTLGFDLLTPSVPWLNRSLGEEGLRQVLRVLSDQKYTLGEPEFGIVSVLYLLVFEWFRPERSRWWIWAAMFAWAVAAQRTNRDLTGTIEVLPGIEVFASRFTLVGTAMLLVVFWRNWRSAWPVLLFGTLSIAVWHGVNIYGIAVPWNVPSEIETAIFHGSIVWMSMIALMHERKLFRLREAAFCQACGYDLAGLACSGEGILCPECGTSREPTGPSAIVQA